MNTKFIFPAAAEREAWQEALKKTQNKQLKKIVMARAKQLLTEPVPVLTASMFMMYVRTGNRSVFEGQHYFKRRRNLNILVLAECFEYKGRFIDRIMDYIWEITSEHTWCVPAHCKLDSDPFPEFPVEIVDLFNSETGLVLASAMNLLGKEISAVSANFVKMVRDEIIRRIAVPLEKGPEPFWYGGINNWTPWCCNNSLAAILWALKEQPERQQKLVDDLHNAIKKYIKLYPEDGFCFEGPAYWVVSPGRMLYFLEQLGVWYDDPKLKPMAEYIADTKLTSKNSLNFGDSWSKTTYTPWLIYRFGERLNNDFLKSTAMDCLKDINYNFLLNESFNSLAFIFWLPAKSKKCAKKKNTVSFYPKTQFFIMRQDDAVLAAKRGHAWSHHHMDIGHFMLFYKDEPVIIDLGSKEYTKDTFTDKRFLSDILNDEGHNMLHFNGKGQLTESSPAPGAMTADENKDCIKCRMDLTTAYAPEAKVKSCIRELVYDRKAKVLNVYDTWDLAADNNDIYANFFTTAKIRSKDGKLFIGDVILSGENCEIAFEKVRVTDVSQLANWGKWLNKIQIRTKAAAKDGWHLTFEFAKKDMKK